jgi:hypothetical protein
MRTLISTLRSRVDETQAVARSLLELLRETPRVNPAVTRQAMSPLTSIFSTARYERFDVRNLDHLVERMIRQHEVPVQLFEACLESANEMARAPLTRALIRFNAAAGEPAEQSFGDGVKVPIPALYTFRHCPRTIGGVRIDPSPTGFGVQLRPYEELDLASISLTSSRPPIVPSNWDIPLDLNSIVQSLRPLQLEIKNLGSSLPTRWSIPETIQETFRVTDAGRISSLNVQAMLFKVRFQRMIREIRWESEFTSIGRGVSLHQRDPASVAETGYELVVDPTNGVVVVARELSIAEWNALRVESGLQPLE